MSAFQSISSLQNGRLPRIVTPTHYDIHYTDIDLTRFTFAGKVSIDVEVPDDIDEPYSYIVLHVIDLNILDATLTQKRSNNGDVKTYHAFQFRYNMKDQTCAIEFPEAVLRSGLKFVLTLNFHGVLNNNMHGFYRSHYTALDGHTIKTIATTQFEPTDARRAFPCFDEPSLKATFALKVMLTDMALKAISNTPIKTENTVYDKINDTWTKIISYETTPKMSTYLVALVIGEMDYISNYSNSVKTSVYTVPGKVHQGQFCLEVATKCLDLYSELFSVPYPLQKSDLLAIPDFAAGAMENWGCVTYREAKILVKEGSTSETMRRGIARTVCHELAHQWFGNLVTMEFWTQLWLNEGFARFMEFVAIDKIFPDWDAWTEFVQEVFGRALALDAMDSSHPVEVEVKDSADINSIFDSISYAKGASIIRMISSYIGFDTFMEGIKLYLNRYAYGNTTSNMLWGSLEEVSGKPVVALMSTWTLQMGYPLIQISNKDDGGITCNRYLAKGPNSQDTSKPWPIPVTAIVEGEEEIQGPWIINGPDGDETAKILDKITEWTSQDKWFKLNSSQRGFYRVSYTPDQWKRLSSVMHPSSPLSSADRLGLISDSFAAGKAGYASIVDSLKLVQNFGQHDTAEYAVWQELSDNLGNLSSLYQSCSFFDKFQTLLQSIYSRQMDIIGWDPKEGEAQRTGTLRGTIINMLTITGKKEVTKEALRRFNLYLEDRVNHAIPGDLQRIIFKAALKEDEPFVFEQLKIIYKNSTFPEEQRNCLIVMGNVTNSELHTQMLEFVLFSGEVRLQDIAFPLARLTQSHDQGGQASWKYMKENFSRIHDKFSTGPMWGACIGLCFGLKSKVDASEVETFFQQPSHPCGSGKKRLIQGLEVIRTKASRLERDVDELCTFLENL